MKTVAATEAKNRLGAILDDAQREPIVIRRQDRDIAVVLSIMAAGFFELNLGDSEVLTMFLVVVGVGYAARDRALSLPPA